MELESIRMLIFDYKLKTYSGGVRALSSYGKALIIKPEIQESPTSVLQRKAFFSPVEHLLPSSQGGPRGPCKAIGAPKSYFLNSFSDTYT